MSEWSTEQPTKPGWYWIKRNDGEIEVVEVYYDDFYKAFHVRMTNEENDFPAIDFPYWFGPLTPPEPPIDETPKAP